jgi:hypothetical protein
MHARIRQRRVQTSQLRSVKRIIRAVVHPRKESHQALGTPGRAMSVNCSRDHLEPSHCPDLDRGMILLERIERIHARPLAGNNVDIARSNSSRWLTGISYANGFRKRRLPRDLTHIDVCPFPAIIEAAAWIVPLRSMNR